MLFKCCEHSTGAMSSWAVFMVTFIFPLASSQLSLQDSAILKVNRGIEVNFGRMVALDPISDLRIQVNPGDRCIVSVLQNDPLSQRPGKLTPNVFNCNFKTNEVFYYHFGARNPPMDHVRLQIRYDSKSESRILPFTIKVVVQFVQLEIITKNMPLVVPRLLDYSDPISSTVLQFSYDKSIEDCKVSILTSANGLPRYGQMANGTSATTMKDCDEFLRSGLRYKHTTNNSPDKDYIALDVVLMNKDGSLKKQEYFQMMVKITGGRVNTKPQASLSAMLIMEVDQFVMTAITPDVLAATDAETPDGQLIFNITSPLSFGEGVIVSTDDRNMPLSSFYQQDVKDLKIAYKPPSIDANVRRVYQVSMEVVDAEGLTSDSFLLMIIVKPMKTLAPVITRNTGIILFEGQSRPLLSSQNLEVSDEDNLKDVQISVVNGLRHGRLELGGRKFFTPADLDAGMITYHHDDSDTYSDNIIFRMTDGKNDVEFLFPVTIYPEDDQPPIVNVNTGLVINKGMSVEVTPFVLSATDIDSDDSSIQFILEPPFSKIGQFIQRRTVAPSDPENWRMTVDGEYEQPVTIFTQADIIKINVFYRHVGKESTSVIMDHVKFKVKDTSNNVSPLNTFIVKIMPVDDQPPLLYPRIKLELIVKEFQTTTIKKKHLRYTDIHAEDRLLKYTITKAPYDVDPSNPLPPGNIVLCDDEDTIVTMFTQAQVNHRKICYKPPSTELGITQRVIRFEYEVQDPSGNVITNQEFIIFLNPVDNKPPVITNTGFSVFENGFRILTSSILDATDPDTDDSLLTFKVTQLPKHGVLQLTNAKMVFGQTFKRADIIDGRIAYKNKGEEMNKDLFKLDVTDGVHHVPIDVKITIRSIDDEAPKMSLPDGTVGSYIEVNEGGSVVISSKILSATDPDTDSLKLTFMLENPPREGTILLNGQVTDRFNQNDIINNLVQYQHTGGEIGTEKRYDMFNLTLTDMSDEWIIGGNRITNVTVYVTIIPVDNGKPTIRVGGSLTVDEGNKTTITISNIDARDIDTVTEEIICTIISQPTQGYVENILPAPGSEKSRVGMPVSAFSIKDIRSGSINYVQSVHDHKEPIEDRFTFKCSDGLNFSPDINFDIRILKQNDEKPEMFVRDWMCQEGGQINIDNVNLNAVDMDTAPELLQFTIMETPKHGKFIHMDTDEVVLGFSQSEIGVGTSKIMYEHDDTETTADSFKLQLTDGNFVVDKAIPIAIIPVDDETPRLTINNGLDVDIHETKFITNKDLKAEDLDSEDKNITYIVKKLANHGYLQRKNGRLLQNITLGMNFSQWEIDLGDRICFIHTGSEGVRDLIKFDVTDGLNPLIDRYFYVSVEGLDVTYPEVVNKGVELPEGGRVILTTKILSTTDLNSPDERLAFTVTRAPSRGHLEITDNPGVPVTTFTQLQLAGNKVVYIHTSGDELKMDSFEFEVTDGHNSVFRTFRISLSDIDNKKPVLMIDTLHIKEGSIKLITPFELKAVDRDTPDKKITFSITKVPLHGSVKFNITKTVTSFTMDDLNNNLISYSHDGSETTSDQFSVTVKDGTHTDFYVFPNTETTTRIPQTVRINVVPVDNGVPQLMINKGASSLSPLPSGIETSMFLKGGLGFKFTNNVMKTEDRDSSMLMYVITTPPKHGYVIDTKFGNKSTTNWTQDAVNEMRVYYILKPGVNNTSDVFYFKVKDKGNNELTEQPFHLNWAWICLDNVQYVVNETDKELQVMLKKRGYLGETSFVGVRTKNGTAKSGEDFHTVYAQQVQFNPGQVEKSWHVRLLDDAKYENKEDFGIELYEPVMAVIEQPMVAKVTITDTEDESTVTFIEKQYIIEENIGYVVIPIARTGDLQGDLMVICSTASGSAKGTEFREVTSGSDYISRSNDHHSLVRFDPNEREKQCKIQIIDDSLYEREESFSVQLTTVMGGRVGKLNVTKVIISPHKEDEPVIYFGSDVYKVDESDGFLDVKVWRTGTDLSQPSSITVRSRKSKTKPAEAGADYNAVNQVMEFGADVMVKTLRINILDDISLPRVEGPETFNIILRMPTGGRKGEPSKSLITINDSFTDLPKMRFKKPEYVGFENDGRIITTIVRSGDLIHISTVRCYTRQDTARVMMDYVERPDTDASIVTFLPGEREQTCAVDLTNNNEFEKDEQFRLVLGTPSSPTLGRALIGNRNSTIIKVKDANDKPVIKFEQTRFSVNEPKTPGGVATVDISVVRVGDLTQTSIVRVYTKDGSAKSGKDYNPFTKELEFGFNVSRHNIKIDILYDGEKEMRESFTVILRPDRNMIAETKDRKAVIYIEEMDKMADVTFPAPPVVVSLRNYDDVENAAKNPVSGYPVACVTPCNPKHPEYIKTGSICDREGINNTLTLFRWRVSAPNYVDGVTSPLQDAESTTFFTNTHMITLDSIYFGAGSRIQCVARAVNTDGDAGLELPSKTVTVSRTEGICMPRVIGSVGAEPFTAKLRYTGPGDTEHPNMVRLSVSVPHRDGMLPVLSTRQLSNFELTLSPDGMRIGQHKCSNLLNDGEKATKFNFLTNATKNPNVIGEVEPYQYSPEMRGVSALRFYRNLDLEACLWEFVSYYDMSELVQQCGGNIGTDGQVKNIKQSYVSVRVPFYVSYVFHSPVGTGGWQHFDLTSELRLTFVYDTAILWQNGIQAADDTSPNLQGFLYPTSMRIQEDGRLVVNFRTEARFRGLFVLSHPGTSVLSVISSDQNPDLTFTLELVRSESTYAQPEQMWKFVSDYAVRDYSGRYKVKLIPCTSSIDQEYSLPVQCNPRDLMTFDLDIRFQQISDPVPTEFSLNTQFHLLRKRNVWLSDGSTGFGQESDSAFGPGDNIYGRVVVDPVQSLGDGFNINIEKVFLCTGKDGYIPKYEPSNGEFGCVVESKNLLHAFKIIDKNAPDTVVQDYRQVPFKATLALDDPSAIVLVKQPGADGFSISADPLFKVDSGRQWFCHTIYNVRSKKNTQRGIRKRSITLHSLQSATRNRRAVEDTKDIGSDKGLGTNMARISLNFTVQDIPGLGLSNEGTYIIDKSTDSRNPNDSAAPLVPVIIGVLAAVIVLVIIIAVIIVRRRRAKKETKTIAVPVGNGVHCKSSSNGVHKKQSIVVNGNYTDNHKSSSEV